MSTWLWCMFFIVMTTPATAAVEITQVGAEAERFDPRRSEAVTIRFRLSDPARVTLRIFDGRDVEVRSVAAGDRLGRGEHRLRWDGKDMQGRIVPAEAYRYTLEARSAGEEKVVWDLSDLTGGQMLRTEAVRWNADAGAIEYILPQLARVRIRIGLKNDGPLLRTLIDWVPRSAGSQHQVWDGLDASGTLDLRGHPALDVLVEAFALSRNTLIVGPPPDEVRLIADLNTDSKRVGGDATVRKRMYAYAQQSIESRRDFPLALRLPDGLERGGDGIPIVRGPVSVRVEVAPRDIVSIASERFEAVYFLDGGLLFETEVGFLPVTFTWNPGNTNPGLHYLSANLRGYEGHFGIATIRVRVAAESRSSLAR